MLDLAALLLLVAPALANPAVAGEYEVHQMEMGGGLELKPNGHFRYAFTYGALDEEASGTWTFDGKTVRLTSSPMPKPPSFELVRDDPAPAGEVAIAVEPPGFGANYRIDAIATDAESGKEGLLTTDDQGRVDAAGHKLAALEPLVPVYGIIGGHFPLDPRMGHHLLLRFRANDMGKARFDGQTLTLAATGLVLKRYGEEIRFIRAQR